ncbi:MAG TPA: hypothetical protein VFZ08_04910 [Terriglobia bacterium]|nr:hypothetical protein [Terriglobia bacterium]
MDQFCGDAGGVHQQLKPSAGSHSPGGPPAYAEILRITSAASTTMVRNPRPGI